MTVNPGSNNHRSNQLIMPQNYNCWFNTDFHTKKIKRLPTYHNVLLSVAYSIPTLTLLQHMPFKLQNWNNIIPASSVSSPSANPSTRHRWGKKKSSSIATASQEAALSSRPIQPCGKQPLPIQIHGLRPLTLSWHTSPALFTHSQKGDKQKWLTPSPPLRTHTKMRCLWVDSGNNSFIIGGGSHMIEDLLLCS